MVRAITKSYIFMALAWLLWSMDPIMIRLIGDDVPRSIMVGGAFLFGGLILSGPALKGYVELFRQRGQWLNFVLYVVLFTVAADIFYAFAIKNLNPGLVSLTLRSQIVMTILVAWWMFGERPNKLTVLGMVIVVLGYAGSSYLSISRIDAAGRNASLGWICALSSALLGMGGTVMGKKLLGSFKSSQLCGMRMLTGGVVALLFTLGTEGTEVFSSVSGRQWLMLFGKAALCSALAYSLYLHGLQLAPVTAAAAMELAAPVFTLMVAGFFLGETINLNQILGVAVVFLGAFLILWTQWKNNVKKGKSSC